MQQAVSRIGALVGLAAVAAICQAQGTVVMSGITSAEPGNVVPVNGQIRFTSAISDVEFGVRVDPPSAVQSLSVRRNRGTVVSQTTSQVVYRTQNVNALDRIGLSIIPDPAPNFVGAIRVTVFVRTPGATTNLFTGSRLVSVGTLPPPDQLVPNNNETISPAPAFRLVLNTAITVPVIYQVEIVGPTPRSINFPAQNTNTSATFYTPTTGGLAPGLYTWRARTLDEAGRAGSWGPFRSFLSYGGIDMASGASQSFFNQMYAAGWDTFFAASMGGRNLWPAAGTNLQRAANAGMKVAMYVFLNFDNGSTIAGAPANQTGDWQVNVALQNIGYNGNKSSLPYDLKYVMIDIENQFMGTMSTQDRVQRIAEAVQRARNLGFWPMIYTRNEGVNQWWNQFTGSSQDFLELPLWASKPELETAVFKDHLSLDVGNPWVRFGGWEDRAGKQYLLDITVLGARIDLNTWRPEVWNVTSPPPGNIAMGIPVVTAVRQPDNTIKLTAQVANGGSVEAYGVRLGDAFLNGVLQTGRTRVGFIPPGGTKNGSIIFPATAATSGSTVSYQLEVWTGMGRTFFSGTLLVP